MAHIVIALAISGVFMWMGVKALPYVGALGYLFREVTQWEEKKTFDTLGVIMPLLACILLAWIL